MAATTLYNALFVNIKKAFLKYIKTNLNNEVQIEIMIMLHSRNVPRVTAFTRYPVQYTFVYYIVFHCINGHPGLNIDPGFMKI